jgi:hypothetical protein
MSRWMMAVGVTRRIGAGQIKVRRGTDRSHGHT